MDLPELESDWMSPVPGAVAQLERRTPTKGEECGGDKGESCECDPPCKCSDPDGDKPRKCVPAEEDESAATKQVAVDPDATTTEKSPSDAMDVIKQVAGAAEPILMNIVIPLAESTMAYLFPKLHAEVQQCEKHLKRLGESLLLKPPHLPTLPSGVQLFTSDRAHQASR